MLKGKFIKLTGFWPSDEIYQEVNADYEASNIDKMDFCANLLQKKWPRKIADLGKEAKKAKGILATKQQTIDDLTEKMSQKDDYIEALEDTVEVYRGLLSELNDKLIKLMVESKKN